MKRKNIMKLLSVSVILSLFLFNCSSDSNDISRIAQDSNLNYQEQNYQEPFVKDFLSYEISFGSELFGTKDEFLLVRPVYISVNYNGDILITDEGRIKVFDKNGKGKKIIGRPGKGPGEFESQRPETYISPEGFITVFDDVFVRGGSVYNLFAPDYSLIEKKRCNNNPRLENFLRLKLSNPEYKLFVSKVFALNASEKIYLISNTIGSDPYYSDSYYTFVYENPDTLIKLTHFKMPGAHLGGWDRSLGLKEWNIIPGRKLVYINTDDDIHDDITGSWYTIHIISLDDFKDTKITHRFSPVSYPEERISYLLNYKTDRTDEMGRRSEISQREKGKKYKERKYLPSAYDMRIDLTYAFVIRYHINKLIGSKESYELEVDSFDLNAVKYIGSFNLPPTSTFISNGCVYQGTNDKEGFYILRKYKINPIVYGLPEDPDWKTKK